MGDKNIRTIEQLEQYASFTADERSEIAKIIESHPMSLTQYYLDLIDWDDPDDPIRRMVIPSKEECGTEGSYDTSGESDNTKVRGLQHKYSQTALILATNQCASYCRHCFRKRLAGVVTDEIVTDWDLIVEYLSGHKEITNVLLSGGDPLTLPNDEIADILQKLSGVQHLKFIRIGTRIPVVDPDRIIKDDELLNILRDCSRERKQLYIVTQFDHPREITPRAVKAINMLSDAHMTVLNQTVLLKGVNDKPEVLAELQSKLTKNGVTPYYVFQCRPVKTIKHIFQIPLYRALEIVEETRTMLDGPSKRFRFVMSHETGKIEVVGRLDDHLYFKYHQAKDKLLAGKLFRKKINKNDCWLDL
ncbi:MAG: KamA family radical SAM protein [Candidatus Krumholzibacteria bacterium]|nr:KamA family radical SAM protein [Candidatus Krumholzibacteria bacterium]